MAGFHNLLHLKKSLIILLFIIILHLPLSAFTQEYTPDPTLEEKVKRSVVKIIQYDSKGVASGAGTGFFVTSTKIITNRHVINGGSKAELISVEGEKFPISGVVAYDQILDVVLLEAEVPFNKFYNLSTSSFLPSVGDTVIIIGNPWGRGPRTSSGKVIDILDWEFIGKVIGYDAPTYPGNSGSPVFTPDGYVIGIATWGVINSKTPHGYAIPYERVLELPRGMVDPLDQWNAKMTKLDQAKQFFLHGKQLLKAGDYQGSIVQFKAALDLNSEFAECWMLLGFAEYKTGLFDEAAEHCKKAVRYRHDFKEAYFQLALALEGMSKFEEAAENYERVLMIEGSNVDAHYRLGCLYVETGNKNRAMEKYKELIDLDASKARALRRYIEMKFNKTGSR